LGLLLDIDVRTAQIYLIFLGYYPGPIDGVAGRFTYSAINEFQIKSGIPVDTAIDEELLSILKKIVNAEYYILRGLIWHTKQ
jgi:peptidoglycan hydrolase-like protein with peptidoglycan-binding domain